jgi:hypothetical protein
MKRVVVALGATLVTALVATGSLLAQNPPAPQLQPILEGRKVTPPLRGEAQVEFTSTKPARVGENIVTKFTVKNDSKAPIARLEIDETWYDKSGGVLTGGRGVLNGLLQPEEVQVITIETPWKAGMTSNNYNFKHVNGTVKPKRVPKLDAPKPAATAKK